MLTQAVQKFRDALLANNSAATLHGKPGVVICGDFNSLPGSTVYKLLVNGAAYMDEDCR